MRSHLMFQLILDPTWMNNILDLLLVNNEEAVANYEQTVNYNLSDHNTLIVNMKIYPGCKKKVDKSKDYYETNIHLLDVRRMIENEANWTKYEKLMDEADWCITQEVDPDMKLGVYDDLPARKTLGDIYNEHLNTNIELCENKAFNFKSNKSPGNKIPLRVRKMIKRKKSISKLLLRSKDATKITNLRFELRQVELDL